MSDPAAGNANTGGKIGDDQKTNIEIPKEVYEKYPELIPQIMESKSMDNEERSYWFSVLPIMTDDQVKELRDILATEQKKKKEEDPISDEDLKKVEERREKKQEEREERERRSREVETEELEDVLAELGL